MSLLCRLRAWLTHRRHERHRTFLRRNKVRLPAPDPRCHRTPQDLDLDRPTPRSLP